MGSEPAVELAGVSKRYATTTAVDDVSVTVERGEFFTLVGPSGCGKTTTLRLLGGFESPSEGTLRLDGEDVTGVPPEDRGVGVVFQSYALFPHMTVGENVAYGLQFAEPPGGVSINERVRELLSLVDLDGMRERDPAALSGGQQQRVAIARALAPGPEVLLLDEPMSALDARLRERLRLQIQGIQEELGVTTVYVTHDQEEALAISNRVAVMHDGGLEQVGTPRDIYHRPATRFVAEFVGDNNVFSGTVQESSPSSGQLQVDVGRTTVAVETARTDEISPGDTVVFCVRPERLAVEQGENRLLATVTGTEFLGWTTRLHLDWRGQELLLRSEHELDGEVTVGFNPDDAHLVGVV